MDQDRSVSAKISAATNRRATIILLGAGVLAVGAVWLVPKSVFLMSFVEMMVPGLIPTASYTRNLDSKNPDLVRESLAILTRRKAPVAATRAVELLQSGDDYVWLNAAHYAAVCGRPEAVPFLIKALRHTAWRADNETVRYLRSLTGQNLDCDFSRWQRWWLAQHPDSIIDWTSHLGPSPRLRDPQRGPPP